MKKNWMKLLTLALSVLMVMSLFAGCNVFGNGKDDKGRGAADQTDPTETTAAPGADLIGSWETQVDLAPYYNEAIKAVGDEALAEALTIDELIFTVCFEANDDGTCKFYVDEESTKSTLEALRTQLLENMRTHLESTLAGTGVTLNQILTAQNSDLETMFDQAINIEDLLSINELVTSGTFKVEGNKLFVAKKGEKFGSGDYAIYTVSGNTLTMELDKNLKNHNAMAEMVFPMTLTRK